MFTRETHEDDAGGEEARKKSNKTAKKRARRMHSSSSSPSPLQEKEKNRVWLGVKDSVAGTLSGAACLFTGYAFFLLLSSSFYLSPLSLTPSLVPLLSFIYLIPLPFLPHPGFLSLHHHHFYSPLYTLPPSLLPPSPSAHPPPPFSYFVTFFYDRHPFDTIKV